MAALSLVVAACGDDDNGGGGPPGNEEPVAAFTAPQCTAGVACSFTDASTDPDGADDIESWSWEFGDDGTSTDQNPTHTYADAGTYTVTLEVTDAADASNSVSHEVTVSVPGENQPPVADFEFVCNAQDCTFTDASTDSDGTIASRAWDFGDGNTSTEEDPVHTYTITELTTFDVELTVTDDDGASHSVIKQVAVAPPAGTVCEDSEGEFVPCTLDITEDATVTITLTARDCTAEGNQLSITQPITAVVFEDGCNETVGTVYEINGGDAFTAGTQLGVQVISGSDDPGRIAPAIRVTGAYPEWLLEFDDGEDPTGPGEPDFNDLVLTVTATATP